MHINATARHIKLGRIYLDESKEKVKEFYEWAVNQKPKLILILLVFLLSSSPAAFAWDPTTNDLRGTDSSTTSLSDRFDIDSTTAGLQIGEDGGSIAFTMQLVPKLAGKGFKANGLTVDDQYEIDFTIGEKDFAILFIATGAAAGIVKVFYKVTGGPTWSNGETHSQSGIVSGTPYRSVSLNIGFTLTSSGPSSDSLVELVVTKNCLATLGATGASVTGIFAANFASGTGEPGLGEATPNNRCPSIGGAVWTLSEAKPDFPYGMLVLVISVMGLYVLFRRKK